MPSQPDIINCRKIVDLLNDRIKLDHLIDKGKEGVVYKGHYTSGPPTNLAVKFYIPLETSIFDPPSKLPQFVEGLKQEYRHELSQLREINHQNLQTYISAGVLIYDKNYFAKFGAYISIGSEIPFIVSRYISGVSLDKIFREPTNYKRADIIHYLQGIARGIKHLQYNKIIHNDLRPENIVIDDSTNEPIIIDFGLSKNFHSLSDRHTRLFYDPNPLPKEIHIVLKKLETKNGHLQEDLYRILFPVIDLYRFAILLDELLDSQALKLLTEFDRDYITMMINDLKSWEIKTSDGISKSELTGLIKVSDDIINCLKRLRGGRDYFRHELEEKEEDISKEIVRRSGVVILRNSMNDVLAHPAVRRLHNIKQLSLLHYVYPSAGQSRFDHLLSTLGQAQNVWKALSARASFVYNFDLPSIDRLENLALIHDVNHFPFLHYFQEAGIPEVSRSAVLETFLTIPSKRFNGEDGPTLEEMLENHNISIEYLRTMMLDTPPFDWKPEDQIIKSLINSGVDIDKMAYLPDDAAFSGVPYGNGIDFYGLFSGIDVAQIESPQGEGQFWHVVFDENALPAVESLCFARYWSFKRLYWHHTNRAIASMIIWTIRELYGDGNNSASTYLQETLQLGEAGALENLSHLYHMKYAQPAPIEGLSTNRERIYRRIFEISFEGREDDLLQNLQESRSGATLRASAQRNVYNEVQKFVHNKGYSTEIYPSEVILDIPLRKVGLGGPIYIRSKDREIRLATHISHLLRELEANFDQMSKVLRVFVAPRLKICFQNLLKNEVTELHRKINDAIHSGYERTEIQ